TTGRNPVPAYKIATGYRYEPQKFAVAGLTPVPSQIVAPPRVAECPVHLEAVLKVAHQFEEAADHLIAAEVHIVRTYVDERLLVPGTREHIDPDVWKPLIMSFTEFYGLGERVHASCLATIYRPQPVGQHQG